MHTLRRTLAGTAVLSMLAGLPLSALGSPTEADQAPFGRVSTYPVYLNVPAGTDRNAQTNAEISTVSQDGNTLIYTDAAGKRIGFLDISDPSAPRGLGSFDLAKEGDADDQPTSVAACGDYLLVVVDQTGKNYDSPSGRVDVVRIADREKVASIDLKGQPDSIAISPDGKYAAIAIENQRDEDRGDGGLPQLPAGFVQTIELNSNPSSWKATPVYFVDKKGNPDPKIAAAGWDSPTDPEPEYVSINEANQLAVTVQENNGVAIIDLPSKSITSAFSTGKVDLKGIDVKNDGLINPTGSLQGVPREPDAIAWVGNNYVATANEGDWKGGSWGWSIFDTSGKVVYDSGNEIENLAIKYGLHNEKRAEKKGPEPEGLAVATFAGVPYAFVATERSNFVAVYDVSDPATPVFKQLLFTTNGPEGILPIPAKGILAVSSETDEADAGVRASVNLYKQGAHSPMHLTSAEKDGAPIGWTAMSGLSPDPTDPTHLYAVSDDALAESYIYRIGNIAENSPVIDERITVTDSGLPASLDLEGVAARTEGGFWLAHEGKSGAQNALYRTDANGAIQERVSLPTSVTEHIGKWGLEGVAATGTGKDEVLYVAVQRPLWKDPKAKPLAALEGNSARIGRYQVATKSWTWYSYPLTATSTEGDWMGLSDITVLGPDTLAVIERDKLNGPAARIKKAQAIRLPNKGGKEQPIPVQKLGSGQDLREVAMGYAGWMQEKFEGLAMTSTCDVYAITDNDGLKDATGETYFLTGMTNATLLGKQAAEVPCPTPVGSTSKGRPTTSAKPKGEPATPVTSRPSPAKKHKQGQSLQNTGTYVGGLLLVAAGLVAAGYLVIRRRA